MAGTKEILYDPEDEAVFQSRKWHISDTGYAVWRGIDGGVKKTIRLHRLIIGAKPGEIVDHRNRNKLDNRRSNLRICSQSDNAHNRVTNGYTWDKSKNKWMVRYRNTFYGRYDTLDEAKKAYKLARSGVPYQKKLRKLYMLPKNISKQFGRYNISLQRGGVRKRKNGLATLDEALRQLNKWQERG